MYTFRLSDELLADAEIVGDHPEATEVVEVEAPKAKVVKASSKGVKTK